MDYSQSDYISLIGKLYSQCNQGACMYHSIVIIFLFAEKHSIIGVTVDTFSISRWWTLLLIEIFNPKVL